MQRICGDDTQPVLNHGLPAFRLHAQHESAARVASQKTCSVHMSLDNRKTFTKIAGLSFGIISLAVCLSRPIALMYLCVVHT